MNVFSIPLELLEKQRIMIIFSNNYIPSSVMNFLKGSNFTQVLGERVFHNIEHIRMKKLLKNDAISFSCTYVNRMIKTSRCRYGLKRYEIIDAVHWYY